MKTKVNIISFLIIIPVLLSLPNKSFSQKFRLGLKGAVLVGWLQPDTKDVDFEKIRIGYLYGAVGEYHLTENYSFSTGIDFENKGGSIEDTRDTSTAFIKTLYKVQHLQVPFTLKMKTNPHEKITYFGQFGAGLAYRIKARSDITTKSGSSTTTDYNNEAKGQIYGLSSSVIIGAGIEYSLGERTALVIKLLFNKGFTDLAKNKNLKFSHSYIALNAGVLF